ncbi:hypothetical protein [Phenylobacterium sp.]|uniref:hypothetical protein n=1 Tax=Phenylobacterium sp. TaxID=1871053 RepID=UPI00391ABF97
MTRIRYPGVVEARQAFEALKPFRQNLIEMQARRRPFGPDYLILDAVRKALDTAAYHFTGEPEFFALRPPRS